MTSAPVDSVRSNAPAAPVLPVAAGPNAGLRQKMADDTYAYGFVSDIESESAPVGLSPATIEMISRKKEEPQWLLDWRLHAYARWLTMEEPTWSKVKYTPIDYQAISYFSAPRSAADRPKSLDEVDPELLRTYEKLGIPLHERAALAGVAVDAVFDSVSVATTFKAKLGEAGVIFCSFSEAVREHPELVRRYLGSVVPHSDNFYAALNAAVFTDGSFCYIPKGVRCPMELSTYFRINAANTGQFERTLIVAEAGSHVSYLEGCTAPMRDENQLHAAVVELVALEGAHIKYSTVQNWYPGDKNGKGGIYNFVTKRGACRGNRSKISWTQVETGSAITWKYPSVILQGDDSVGEFYSVAVTNNCQQADTGTKMIHLGKNSRSTIVSKGISAGRGQNTYRGQVMIHKKASNARNYTQCDSLLFGGACGAHTYPFIDVKNASAQVEHEASTSKISDAQLHYCRQRGLSDEEAISLVVTGWCREVLEQLPMEFAVEAKNLLSVSLEGSIG
jgi:Fe-S cluster assembly protein SufB